MHATATPSTSHRLLWAGFTAIAAAGVGFSVRAGILNDWAGQFGFTQGELGRITGGGLTGFGLIILIGALLAEKLGYGRLMVFAFIVHAASALLTLAATPIYQSMVDTDPAGARAAVYACLFWGTFLFAIGNGVVEAVVNPLVATLYPKNKTHYLNILHAGWPGGLVVGGLLSYLMVGKVRWEIQMAMFLIPTVAYGLLMLGQSFPRSEARAGGLTYRDMLRELGILGAAVLCGLLYLFFRNDVGWSPGVAAIIPLGLLALQAWFTGFHLGPIVLALLLVVHLLIGYVELGTDSWIGTITGTILADRGAGLLLFVYTCSLMFVLRFFAGPIVHRISPLGLLLASAVLGAIGLFMLGSVTTGVLLVVAATIYGVGKTFLWPTMLGVVSEQFPRGGAITLGAIGAAGMLSAGLLGGPGIGYFQDSYASAKLKAESPAIFEQYKADHGNRFLVFPSIEGLDGRKVAGIRGTAENARTPEQVIVANADLNGGRAALKLTAILPVIMAGCFLILLAYFRARGGYRALSLDHT